MSEFVLDIGLCHVLVAVHWIGSDIGLRQLSDSRLCRLLVAVRLCSGSDIGLRRLLVAFSLCSVSVVFVCIGLDQISGFVGYL